MERDDDAYLLDMLLAAGDARSVTTNCCARRCFDWTASEFDEKEEN